MSPVIETPSHAQGNESARHALVRHFRTAVRLLLALSLGVAFVCLFRYPQAVYLVAIAIPVLYVVLTLTPAFEGGTRVTGRPVAKGSGIRRALRETDTVTLHVPMREFRPRRRWVSQSSTSATGRLGREVSFPLRLASAGRDCGFEGAAFPKL